MTMPYVKTIDQEASILSRLASDLDNYRRMYSLTEEDTDENIFVKFVAPSIIAFENYRFYLLQNSVTKQIQANYYYRPDYVSYDEYGTVNLWAMLLFINNIPTMEDFNQESILVPTQNAIIEVSRDVLTKNLLTNLVPLYDLPPVATPALFYDKQTVPPVKTSSQTVPVFVPKDMYFNREEFTVDVVIARQRCVDLQYEPVVNSLILKIKDQVNYIYGKHYLVTRGTIGNNRVTWDPRLITNGIGLTSVLVEGVEFEISYARQVNIKS